MDSIAYIQNDHFVMQTLSVIGFILSKALKRPCSLGTGLFFFCISSIVKHLEGHNSFIAESSLAVTVDFIGGTSSLSFAMFSWGGVCEDVFGYSYISMNLICR